MQPGLSTAVPARLQIKTMLGKRCNVPTSDRKQHEILAHLLEVINTAVGHDVS